MKIAGNQSECKRREPAIVSNQVEMASIVTEALCLA